MLPPLILVSSARQISIQSLLDHPRSGSFLVSAELLQSFKYGWLDGSVHSLIELVLISLRIWDTS
jgi:hypothetical protein